MDIADRKKVVIIPDAPSRMGSERSPAAEKLKGELDAKGYLVIEDAIPADLLDRAAQEVRDACDRATWDPEIKGVPFYGDRIRRGYDLVAKAPSLLEIMALPLVDTIAQAVMFDSCRHVLLSAANAIDVYNQGDVPPQPLHRDEGAYPAFLPRYPGGPEYTYNIMIAGTDLTEENGGTLLVPGSHLWPRERMPTEEDEIISLEMKKGSAAVWVGSLYHSAGVNRTDDARLGIILGFSAGWLRTIENQFMLLDAEKVALLPAQVQTYLGWHTHNTLGRYDADSPHLKLDRIKVPVLA